MTRSVTGVWHGPWLALCITPTSDQPSLFASTHAGAAGKFDTARSSCLQRSQFIEDTVEPSFFLHGIISLFIMCVGIIRNNSLVSGRARAESNPGHWARDALLHMAAECVNHSATRAGQWKLSILAEIPSQMGRIKLAEGAIKCVVISSWVVNFLCKQ